MSNSAPHIVSTMDELVAAVPIIKTKDHGRVKFIRDHLHFRSLYKDVLRVLSKDGGKSTNLKEALKAAADARDFVPGGYGRDRGPKCPIHEAVDRELFAPGKLSVTTACGYEFPGEDEDEAAGMVGFTTLNGFHFSQLQEETATGRVNDLLSEVKPAHLLRLMRTKLVGVIIESLSDFPTIKWMPFTLVQAVPLDEIGELTIDARLALQATITTTERG